MPCHENSTREKSCSIRFSAEWNWPRASYIGGLDIASTSFSRLNVQTDKKPSRTSLPCPQNMKTSWPISQLWLTTSVPLDFRNYIAFIMFLRRVLELSKQDSQDKITLNVSSLPCAYDHRLQGSSLNESLCKTALAVQNIYASWQAH